MKLKKLAIIIFFLMTVLLAWSAVLIVKGKRPTQQQMVSGIVANKANQDNFAPDFTLTTLDGKRISLSDYRSKKPVILDFWASWCPNCQRNMPKEQKLYKKYQDQIEVLGINVKEYPSAIRAFVLEYKITFPILLDDGKVVDMYGVLYTNFHVLITKEGKILRLVPGDISEDHFRELLLRN